MVRKMNADHVAIIDQLQSIHSAMLRLYRKSRIEKNWSAWVKGMMSVVTLRCWIEIGRDDLANYGYLICYDKYIQLLEIYRSVDTTDAVKYAVIHWDAVRFPNVVSFPS